ncbi:MAG: aspartate dehydrogenase domain-containing protein [Acidimicrobiales bacterium]
MAGSVRSFRPGGNPGGAVAARVTQETADVDPTMTPPTPSPASRPDDHDRARPPRRVGVIGHGAVGSVVAEALDRGVPGLVLAGVHARSPVPDRYRAGSFDELLSGADLVVEAASQEAVASYGPAVVAAGADLLVVSVGALRDDGLLATLGRGAGRLLVTTGAIGGVDQLRAAALLGSLDEVSLTTTKPPRALVRPWMSAAEAAAVEEATAPVAVYDGPAREAVERFPTSVNVAATLSLVTIGFDRVHVRLVADPATDHVEHHIVARGAAGDYEFRFRNVPSPANVRTSAVTPFAVLRGLADLDAHTVIGF